ncbi:MAG: ribonuclease Y [Candidatus Woykebacteria bacterium RIFCSPHIGHO2_01_FULL_43_29]|uniref:Ribonuclease Y n=2 Tax=Candidatus Woykeibacteriota TaxID=1817899 RepID=A0A1G1WYE5_9BACT|nr:MAG: ribonuclease Y [Candidatus Woykebacteria bacterium RIFCSPHIGHO2_01_FULL_43_29]OGY29705.1 MAG: ribonuclease Y [Candidatus Woykebacteria bacterium RIFCSPHIGHO2_02_FULL_43_16b]OGY32788.1 MAG: ribonuclease Y [Candidatus Woykebacteria bacterium RIFCSPLOWO2_01_FULL_43_14]
MSIEILAVLSSLLALGVGAGGALYYTKTRSKSAKLPQENDPEIIDAATRAKELVIEAKDEAFRIKKAAEDEARNIKRDAYEQERKLTSKEEVLERKSGVLEERERNIASRSEELKAKFEEVEKVKSEQIAKLERAAGLTREEARTLIMEAVESRLKEDISRKIKESETFARQEADKKAREILVDAMQSVATDYVPETTTSVVKLPDDEMKGRIIGKEGRNIRAFENATGVDVEIDETPGELRLSCFDPIRREVAKVSLEILVKDGRIQPARIEEVVAKTQKDIERVMRQAGEDLVYKAGIHNMPREIIDLLGRFKYRTSYGQNQWLHTLEVVKLASSMANQIGARVELAKQLALLHDIGKTVTHEVEGSHVDLGVDIAKRYGLHAEIVKGLAAQHEDDFPSIEAAIAAIADAISGARPGARRESVEEYIKRISSLENIATGFSGVEKAFAIEAGREVRVLVVPSEISDADITKLAHDIASKIQEQVVFPGEVKVNVIRETRAVDVAR